MAVYNQRSLVFEWDWIWQCRSTVYREATGETPGYIETEVRIPVDKLQNKNRQQIGIDLQLFAYKPDGSSYFYALTPGSEILSVKETHKLDIEPFEESFTPDVTAIPFVVAHQLANAPTRGSAGGDVNVSLDKHKLKATFQTDESTLEAYPFQFSLYGQSIFLQEKRPVLSKDLDIYRSPINLFYTRAIQDIRWGANYTFRSNAMKGGVVVVEDEFDPTGTGPQKRHLAVMRSTWETGVGNLGTTLLYGRNISTRATERMLSFNGRVDLPGNLRIVPQWATNSAGSAYQIELALLRDYSGGPYASALYRRFGERFEVSTLFNDYGTNYDEVSSEVGYRTVSNRTVFSQIEVYGSYYRARTLSTDFTYQHYGSMGMYNLVLEFLNLSNRVEVNFPEEGTPGGVITHRNILQDHNAKFILGSQALTVGYNFGPYFGTYLKNPYINARIILWDRLAWNITLNHRAYANVKQTIARLKLDARIIDGLYFRSFIQKDNFRRQGQWNTLLQYEFFAGSNVYLVLNNEGERFENTGKYFKVGYEIAL
jgi:hypothetical protein